jgi:RNA polymerase sigma factor (TIGR02999 family)
MAADCVMRLTRQYPRPSCVARSACASTRGECPARIRLAQSGAEDRVYPAPRLIRMRRKPPAAHPAGILEHMTQVTRVLYAIEHGDPKAAEQLLPLVYDELRKLAAHRIAQEVPGQTLNATALVHEAYLRLVGNEAESHWNSRGHFFAAAAEAMRRLLVEQARRKRRMRHGGGRVRIDLEDLDVEAEKGDDELLALDEALQRLTAEEPTTAEVVKLRYFAGLTAEAAAAALGISLRTANRHWAYAKAWLYQQLSEGDGTGP